MKDLKVLSIIVLVSAACGFLLCLLLVPREQQTEIVRLPVPYPDTTLFRKIDDLAAGLQPIVIVKPGTSDTDTVWIDLDQLPLREYATVDSLPISINREILYTVYDLTFRYRGKAEDYRVRPLRNAFETTTAPRVNPWSAVLLTGVLIDHELRLQEIDLLEGLIGYRRILLHGKILLEPVDRAEDQFDLQWRAAIGVKLRLL